MNSEQWRDYKSALAQDLEQAEALPFNAYTDPELYEAEQQHIFHADWVFVCAAQQLQQPGDYYALRLAGEPIAVLRGQDGLLRALSNVCRHRHRYWIMALVTSTTVSYAPIMPGLTTTTAS